MKGIGFVGIVVMVAGGVLIYSGFTNIPPLEIIAALLRGEKPTNPNAAEPATPGSSGQSGFEPGNGGAGQGAGGGGGGGW